MVRSTWFAALVAPVAMALIGSAQAQTVHKCIINGAAVYQAAACPASNDQKSLVIPAAPSQQELLDATANGRLQSVAPGSGNNNNVVTPRRYERNKNENLSLTPSLQDDEAVPGDNCDQLNKAYHEAQYRRDELSAPGNGAHRTEALQRAWDDINQAQQRAAATHCHLR